MIAAMSTLEQEFFERPCIDSIVPVGWTTRTLAFYPCSLAASMFDTILIAVDLSATNDVVLDRATALGASDHTEIILLHIIETLDGVSVEEDPEFYEELHENATKKMTPWAEQLQAAGFDVTARVDYGKQGQAIVAAARDTNADLVVMRSHVVDTNAESTDQVGTVSH